MAISEKDLYIIPFADADQVSAFCSASEDLNDFLKNEALNSQETLLSRTFLCFWREHLTGFWSEPLRVDKKLSNADSWREVHEEDQAALRPGLQDISISRT